MSTDLKGNEDLKDNTKAFDLSQLYYKQNAGFITKYIGTFKTKQGTEVSVFEKIEGNDFDKCNANNMSLQCRLLAQAATAIAISHEAGCINSDIKPANMMVTKNSALKLIDQGAIINLTKGKTEATAWTRSYAAPEIASSNLSPAVDVFSLGVSILEKFAQLPNSNKGFTDLSKQIKYGFAQENGAEIKGNFKDFYRKNISKKIDIILCEKDNNIIEGWEAESKFIGLLLKDCLAFKPEDRISAAQAGEILQVFSSYLEEKEQGSSVSCPDYNSIKSIALQDCPKGIPIALRKMLFNPKTQEEGIAIIKNLVEADPSYKNTPSYGFILLLNDQDKNFLDKFFDKVTFKETFQSWAEKNREAVKWLKERTYIQGHKPQANQDMPVPEDIYKTIQKLK